MIQRQKALLGFNPTKKDDWLNLSIKNGLLIVTNDNISESWFLENNAIDYIVSQAAHPGVALQEIPSHLLARDTCIKLP